MDTTTGDHARLCEAVTACLNTHDLLGVLDLGAPADEYAPEMKEFVQLLAAGEPVTPEAVACVWHKWLGDPSEPGPPTAEMGALASDLQALSPFAGH